MSFARGYCFYVDVPNPVPKDSYIICKQNHNKPVLENYAREIIQGNEPGQSFIDTLKFKPEG